MRKQGWFCDLPSEVLIEYDAIGTHLAPPAGSALFLQGQAPRGVSVLCAGEVKLTKTSKDGKTFLVRIATPGDVLGLSATLSETPYEVTAQAIAHTEIKTIERNDFLHFLENHVEGSLHAATSLNHEYRSVFMDACRLALSNSIAGRMAHLLLQMTSDAGTAQDIQPEIHLSLKHEDLASMLGTTRESITRVLNDFKRQNILSIKGSKVKILRKIALEILV